jgi:hypothetical protein
MTDILLQVHSILRWVVTGAILLALYRAWIGLLTRRAFTAFDNAVRHWTATAFHVQLMVGIVLFTQSPVVKGFWSNFREASQNFDSLFFGLLHALLMLCAIVIVTIGSAVTKRKTTDREKFASMLLWYAIAFIIVLIAVPWPFSPLAARPYIR